MWIDPTEENAARGAIRRADALNAREDVAAGNAPTARAREGAGPAEGTDSRRMSARAP
jgi:hypothetical protein